MITSGMLMTILIPISYFGISAMAEPTIIVNDTLFLCLIRIPPLMLMAAGILSIIHRESVLRRQENSVEQSIDSNTIN